MRCKVKFWNICRRVSRTVKCFRPVKAFMRMCTNMWKEEWNAQKFKLQHSPPEDFTRSFWQGTPKIIPIWVVYRFFMFLYFLTTYGYMLYRPHAQDFFKSFIYATHWSYTAEAAAFIFSFAIVVKRFIKENRVNEIPPMDYLPWYYKLFWILYTIAAPTGLVISFVFWLFIYDPGNKDAFPSQLRSLVLHACNSLVIVVDFFLSAHPIRFLHFYWPLLFSVTYACFSAVYQFSGGTGLRGEIPIYHILDWRNPEKAVETAIGCVLATLLAHCLFSLLHLLKIWLKKPSDIL